ncbi:MAG TPA: serine/threonine-protein kinase [Kofleriaceae bacterium]
MERGDLTGAVLDGRYKVLEPVAEGAMGVVYRAERIKLGRIVAVKVLHDELPNELSSRKRFEIEAMAMAKLEHPHCAAVLDVGIHRERPFVVMDFVSGRDLRELINEGPMPTERAAEIVRQVLSGLAHAHEHGIIHRDIKPANIVLSQKAGLGDHVKILDFGLARLNADASGLTTGIVVGTPSYMAPEQIRGTAIDGRADLYACGVLMYELLTGKKPFQSPKDDPIEVCSLHLKAPIPSLAKTLPGRDFGELEAVVAKALAKLPDERFQTAVEFAKALTTAIGRKGMLFTPAAGVPITDRSVPVTAPVTAPVAAPAPKPEDPRETVLGGTGAPVPPPVVKNALPTPVPGSLRAKDPIKATAMAFGAIPAPAKPVALPPVQAPAPLFTRKQLAIAGGGTLLVIIIIAIVASASGGKQTIARVTLADGGVIVVGSGSAPTTSPADAVSGVLVAAEELLVRGKREQALQLIVASRGPYPADARLAAEAGKLYFQKMWWTEGLKQLRDAVRLDPTYTTDVELIKVVLKGFNTAQSYGEIARFLRESIGPMAKQFLQETAKSHTNPGVRARAAAELKRYP